MMALRQDSFRFQQRAITAAIHIRYRDHQRFPWNTMALMGQTEQSDHDSRCRMALSHVQDMSDEPAQ